MIIRRCALLTTLALLLSGLGAAAAHAGQHAGQAAAGCEAPAGTPAWSSHQFSVRPTKFKPHDFPVTVQFRTTDATRVLAEVRYTGPGDRPTTSVPEDQPMALYVKTAHHDFMCYWGYWVVPGGSAASALLPFGQ